MNSVLSSGTVEALLQNLKSSVHGLSGIDAATRFREQQKKIKTTSRFARELKLLIRQYTNPLVLLLVAAVILSAVLGETTDTFIILFILVSTGLVGFWQEMNAGRAVEQLQNMIQLKCKVLREGKEIEIKNNEVVSGDILILQAGNIIPTDCRLLESNELHVNESSLTGESFPAEKQTGEVKEDETIAGKFNCLWQGTNVVSGNCKAIVVNTGADTMFGQMAHILEKQEETAFEKGIKHFGFFLLQITLVLSVVILSINIYFKKPLFDSVLFSLALAVGMAPELLPAIMTFAMSAGAKRMLKKKVIVKKLSSIFNFGEVNMLCTDKTGTITEGAVRVKDVVDISGKTNEQAKLFAFVNASLQKGFSNPLDDAIKEMKLPIDAFKKFDEIPYDFIRKRLSVAVSTADKKYLITKGAVQNVADVSSKVVNEKGEIISIDKKIIQQKLEDYSNNGFRVIGLAYKELSAEKISHTDETDMIFLGFILLEDPLKEGVVDALMRLRKMNVEVKIITGDNQYVAAYIAKKIGVEQPKIITGSQLNSMSPESLVLRAAETNVFAEVEPHQKERIIKALQKSHNVVAYMGDGINDVAAIHAADTGISTSNAVDVAKQSADFVLLEKDLNVLADGIYEGRKTFANSLKYIFINTGATFGNMFSVAGASVMLPFLPMLPKQILLTNFLTDLPYITVAQDNVDEEQLQQPGKWNMKLIRNFMIVFGIHSSVFDFITFIVLYFYFKLKDSPFQTGWFLESVITELLILFIIRTRKSFIKSKPGKWLLWASLISFIVTVLLPVSPFASSIGLSITNFQTVAAIAIILVAYVITADIVKRMFFKSVFGKD